MAAREGSLMETSVLAHPVIARTVAAIVADRGGCVEYDQGGGGREVLIAASAGLAAATGQPLTIVEHPLFHDEIRALVAQLQPDVDCTVTSAADAIRESADRIGGVLAVHADVLRSADVRRPLLKRADAADHVVVVRHDYSDTTLDELAGPRHALRIQDLVQPGPPSTLRPVQVPARSSEAAIRLAAEIYALDQDIAGATPPEAAEVKQLRRTGMLEALCIVLETHHDANIVLPPTAELLVASEGARRFRSQRGHEPQGVGDDYSGRAFALWAESAARKLVL
jgi:hypothetical protein